MKFGEKVKDLRTQKKLSQGAFAKAIGVGARAVFSWENEGKYPRNRDIYKRMAAFCEVDINYLLTEDEHFIIVASERYGSKGAAQARALLEQTSALFAGGELPEDDQLAFVHEIQQIYLDSKERAREKFTPKKYRKTDE